MIRLFIQFPAQDQDQYHPQLATEYHTKGTARRTASPIPLDQRSPALQAPTLICALQGLLSSCSLSFRSQQFDSHGRHAVFPFTSF